MTATCRLIPQTHILGIGESDLGTVHDDVMLHHFFLRRLLWLRFLDPLFCLGLAFPQPVTAILVVCLMTAPFWPVMVVGMVSDWPHMLPFALAGRLAASPECGPSGSLISNTPMGASGTLAKVLEVMPCLMSMLPVSCTVTPPPCRMATTSGNAAPPCDTKYTGPVTGTAS